MEIVLAWIVGAFVAAWIAKDKGRSGTGFFWLSLLVSPLFGIPAALGAQRADQRLPPPVRVGPPPAPASEWIGYGAAFVAVAVVVVFVASRFAHG